MALSGYAPKARAAFPRTPHGATWQPKKDVTRSIGGYGATYAAFYPAASTAYANDGKGPSELPPLDLMLYIEPKTAFWALQKYGVETERQPYLIIGRVPDMEGMERGDVLLFEGRPLEIQARPMIYPPTNGYAHAEAMAVDKRSGGRP